MEVRSSLNGLKGLDVPSSTASVQLTKAGETAKVVRYEYMVGGDIDDLMVLIDKIMRHKVSTDFVIVPATYTKNGKVVPSDRPGAVLFYSNQKFSFGELVPNGFIKLEKGARAGQTVERYKISPPQLVARIKELFDRDRVMFDALSADIKNAFILGTLGAPDKFTPAVVDLTTGKLKGVDATSTPDTRVIEQQEDDSSIDGLNMDPEAPAQDEELPF
jgi:hypothetical protein